MGNTPSECYMGDRLKCCKCHKVLPPCCSFDDFYKATVHGRFVYVYNNGEYYRPVGEDMMYECEYCFHKPVREQETMKIEEKKKEEERKRRDEEQRKEELNQKLKESRQRAEEQYEIQQTSGKSEECESKQNVLIFHPGQFEADCESESGDDNFLEILLEILSLKYDIDVSHLTLTDTQADQLSEILWALDDLLFDEWIDAPPSLNTLHHAQVYITELCVLFLEISEEDSPQIISDNLQSLVESISQSASDVSESFMLTQALYLTLMHFITDSSSSSETDAVVIAKRWAEEELSIEQLSTAEFLHILTSSLNTTVERDSIFPLNVEIQCFKLLLSTLAHLNDKEIYSETTEMILRLVQDSTWTPVEAVDLLKVLSQTSAQDASIAKVLTLVHVYEISPEWTDESGQSLIQALMLDDLQHFHQDLQKTCRKINKSSLTAALGELKTSGKLDDFQIEEIQNITSGVLMYLENPPNEVLFLKDSLKCGAMNADEMRNCLSHLCKAVFDTKGWWPTIKQMLQWCVLVLTEKTGALQVIAEEDDPCVTAMFAATQIYTGNKVDIMLSSDSDTEEQIKEWSNFYKNLGISVSTNTEKQIEFFRDVYEADVIYGTLDNFVSDYFQNSKEMMEMGVTKPTRGFIIEMKSLENTQSWNLSRLRANDSLAADVLKNLMSEDMEVRQRLIKAVFKVLHTNLNDDQTENKITQKKLSGKEGHESQIFILAFLETLTKVVSETEAATSMTSSAGKWFLENVFASLEHSKNTSEETKQMFRMVSNLLQQTLWSPEEIFKLLRAITHHHHDQRCISIMKILHLMETYQVSSKWTDENHESVLKLIESRKSENLIKHLKKNLRNEPTKNIEILCEELNQLKDIDEEILSKTYRVVTHVTDLIKKDTLKKHKDVQKAKSLSHSLETEDLQEVLAVLCNAVNLHKAEGKWWPRTNQMMSWCLLTLSTNGKLLEMGTGEGKSCVIAMFAALRVLRGEKVDVVSSSSLLCQRDAEEWNNFYKYFGITVDTNTNKTNDHNRKECYQKDIIYGTIEDFAADHLRQIFEMKDVRPDRSFQCIIIDEVDSLLLDQGVQLTYLSSPMVSMQHLNIILTMIWSYVQQYGFLSSGHKTFVQGPPASFFKAIFDSINTEETEINDPMDILSIAEATNIVPSGFTEDFFKSQNEELPAKLKTVSQDSVVDFLEEMENYVPYGFTVYTLNDEGLLCLRKSSPYNNKSIPEIKFLVLEEGLCCPLHELEEILNPITQLILDNIQYTPCQENENKIKIPGFLENLVVNKMSVWVENAFLAKRLHEGRDYVVENGNICPVDFRSTGLVELNKKWGDGLQQFVEIKHQIKLSTISTVTNYLSNISFFQKYQGEIYGTTGTLGSERDIQFLQTLYPSLSTCRMPTFNRKKLREVKGILKRSSEEWKSEIKQAVMVQISSNIYRQGRAALVICETINKANEIYQELKTSVPGETVLYSRNDKDGLSKIERELCPGDVIVATNLAGRGTDIKVSKQVNENGGLFVILSFLSENTRVELQAFGRTARKGEPGSAQIIMCTEHLQQDFRTVRFLGEAKSTRDKVADERMNHMMNDVNQMNLREDLFSEYCNTLQDIYKTKDRDDRRAVVAIMNEFWGIWLQIKSEDIEHLKNNELIQSLNADLSEARRQCQSQTSPCSSVYHYIKFGNIALEEKRWDVAAILFEKAMKQDESWAAIAFYSHAYCTIKQKKADYLTNAKEDLLKAQESIKYLNEECMVCLRFIKMGSAESENSDMTNLEKQFTTKFNMYKLLDENINEAIQKLDEINEKERDASSKRSPIFSLVSNADEDLQAEADNLYGQGLKYVFAVEQEPRFSWGGLLVCFLGVLQFVGGFLLTVFTAGALASLGMELVYEGISDCIYGIEAMVTGEFSWKSWAINKAISIFVSLIGFGIGKLIAKGFKSCKAGLKLVGKELKSLPKFFSRQAKEGVSAVVKMNMKNAVKLTGKKIVEEIVIYGFGKAEEKILKAIMNTIKSKVTEDTLDKVKSNLENKPLAASVDSIIFSHLGTNEQLCDLLKDETRRADLLDIFRNLSKTAAQPFFEDLSWQHKLNSTLISITDRVKSETKGKVHAVLTAIQVTHLSILLGDASRAVSTLSSKFFTNLQEQLNTFKQKYNLSEKVNLGELSPSDTEMLKSFKQDLANIISNELADTLVEVFDQKFSSHIVSYAQRKVNGIIRRGIAKALKSPRTEEKLKAGQYNRYLAHMPVNVKSKHAANDGEHSRSHAEKIKDPKTEGTILDIRVLSEATGTKVTILREDKHGKLTKMQEVNPSTKPASQNITLIYRPKSSQYPNGHYDAVINNKTVRTDNKDSSCLFHSFARAANPRGSETEITLRAEGFRSVVANTLHNNPTQWNSYVRRKDWIETIRGGHLYTAAGGAPISEEKKNKIRENTGKIGKYKSLKAAQGKEKIGQLVEADHQPPVQSILDAIKMNQNSTLATAMLEVATNSSNPDPSQIEKVDKHHGRELPAVFVPKEIHRDFLSTKSQGYRIFLAKTISNDEVEKTFKAMVIGSMSRYKLDENKGFNNFRNNEDSNFNRKTFNQSFKIHSKKMVDYWFSELQRKNVMRKEQRDSVINWIDDVGYKKQNDPVRQEVIQFLKTTKTKGVAT